MTHLQYKAWSIVSKSVYLRCWSNHNRKCPWKVLESDSSRTLENVWVRSKNTSLIPFPRVCRGEELGGERSHLQQERGREPLWDDHPHPGGFAEHLPSYGGPALPGESCESVLSQTVWATVWGSCELFRKHKTMPLMQLVGKLVPPLPLPSPFLMLGFQNKKNDADLRRFFHLMVCFLST